MRRPDAHELPDYARKAGLTLSQEEVGAFVPPTDMVFDILEALEALPGAVFENIDAVREAGRPPTREEDPLNAVIRRCRVQAESTGALSGKRIGVKDSIAVAGVPMTMASVVLNGFVPEVDSVVVDRMLSAGAEIVAKLNMDGFAWSGSGATGDFGNILNPLDQSRSAGGSSGGTAAALYYDWIDITLGGDQAGSNRIPASWCGVLGIKPTTTLIPYTGVVGIDATVDHVAPMTRSTADMALMLDVLAGSHPSDPRQRDVPKQDYAAAVEQAGDDLRGTVVGVLKEGFGDAVGVEPASAAAVNEVVERFSQLGAEVREVSVPEHLSVAPLAFGCYCEGQLALFSSGGNGYGWTGRYSPELAMALGQGLRERGDALPPNVKTILIVASYLRDQYFGAFYAKAQNLRPWLRSSYDRALADVDVIAMPTTPFPAFEHAENASIGEVVERAWSMAGNTAGVDLTGHPSLSIPAAHVGDLPLGVMLIGRHFDDARLLSFARTYEQAHGWFPDEKVGACD